VAVRARATGGQGGIVTEHAYHGVTTAIADLSPEEWPGRLPTGERGDDRPAGQRRHGHASGARAAQVPLAATFLDGAVHERRHPVSRRPRKWPRSSTRPTQPEGLFVADEVQAGHGRAGDHLWSLRALRITPDLVTLGKPMGNGYPVAAVITRQEIAERLAETTHVFSTFGGNPVAAQAALAVLDVIEDERLVEHAARVGARLIGSLEQLGARSPRPRAYSSASSSPPRSRPSASSTSSATTES
jgi:4-aminobutyrate aminotransferase-like enzyme